MRQFFSKPELLDFDLAWDSSTMKQISFTSTGFDSLRKSTRKREFLDKRWLVVTGAEHAPAAKTGSRRFTWRHAEHSLPVAIDQSL